MGVVVFAKEQGIVNLKVQGPEGSTDFEILHVRGPSNIPDKNSKLVL